MSFWPAAIVLASGIVGCFLYWDLMRRMAPTVVGRPLSPTQTLIFAIFCVCTVFLALVAILIAGYFYLPHSPGETPIASTLPPITAGLAHVHVYKPTAPHQTHSTAIDAIGEGRVMPNSEPEKVEYAACFDSGKLTSFDQDFTIMSADGEGGYGFLWSGRIEGNQKVDFPVPKDMRIYTTLDFGISKADYEIRLTTTTGRTLTLKRKREFEPQTKSGIGINLALEETDEARSFASVN